jgi:predicted PurR-regulated permease PerM
MFFIGLLSGLGAAIIGLPSALLLGFLAGALALIPNLGPATATIIAAVVAWTQGSAHLPLDNFTVAFLVVGWFGLVQVVEGFWLTPRVMGRRVNIHPGIVMVAIVGTLITLGALVALIIVPIMASMILVIGYVRRKRAGLDPWPVEEPIQIGESDPV